MKTRSGYTLVEVLVAVVILGIALPGLSYMVLGSRKAQVSSYRMEQAAAFGQVVIDSLSVLPDARRDSTTNMTESNSIGGILYTANWTYTRQGTARKVATTVAWNHGGRTESVTIQGVVR
jgi:prepilin-type N-terminal cleavage/methylation domain-containing protein